MTKYHLLPDPLGTDSTQETGPEYVCAHCGDTIYAEELLEGDYEVRHAATGTTLSADGSHEAQAVPL